MLVCYVSVNIPHFRDMKHIQSPKKNMFAQIFQKSGNNPKISRSRRMQ